MGDIERMVQEAEEFQEEDKKVRDKIESRNALENYVYSMKNTLGDSEKGVADKIGDDEKLKEVQDTCSPIISKVYQESGGAPGGGGDFGDCRRRTSSAWCRRLRSSRRRTRRCETK